MTLSANNKTLIGIQKTLAYYITSLLTPNWTGGAPAGRGRGREEKRVNEERMGRMGRKEGKVGGKVRGRGRQGEGRR